MSKLSYLLSNATESELSSISRGNKALEDEQKQKASKRTWLLVFQWSCVYRKTEKPLKIVSEILAPKLFAVQILYYFTRY